MPDSEKNFNLGEIGWEEPVEGGESREEKGFREEVEKELADEGITLETPTEQVSLDDEAVLAEGAEKPESENEEFERKTEEIKERAKARNAKLDEIVEDAIKNFGEDAESIMKMQWGELTQEKNYSAQNKDELRYELAQIAMDINVKRGEITSDAQNALSELRKARAVTLHKKLESV